MDTKTTGVERREMTYFIVFFVLGLGLLVARVVVTEFMQRRAFREKGRRKAGDARSYAAAVREKIRWRAQTTLWLTPTPTPAFSKLGGYPELPADLQWPDGEDERCDFLCQVD